MAEVLVGGGVRIELAERVAEDISKARPAFLGSASSSESEQRLLFDLGMGDADNFLNGSTGGSERFGVVGRWTWEAICASRSWLGRGVSEIGDERDCLTSGVAMAKGLGVLRRLGLVACGSAVFQVTRGS